MTMPLSFWVVFMFLASRLTVIYSHECDSNPCQNEAICEEYNNAYHCICVPGYTSYNCETDIDECSGTPCENGGTCADEVNGYTCQCVDGFEDDECSTNIDECASSPCNHGTCDDGIDEYNCYCTTGYDGTYCDTDIDECASDPCENDATCVDRVDEYQCTCPEGFDGLQCQTDIDECRSNPCMYESTCVDGIDGYTCSCMPGYEGLRCETDTNECLSDPCQHDGTCLDMINRYDCTCTTGHLGLHCEIIVVCNPDDSIDVWNLPENYNYFAMQNVTAGSDVQCTVSTPNSTSISITGCSKDSQILLTYGSYDGMGEHQLHGGKTTLAVTIQCNEIPDGGNIHAVNNTLLASLEIDRETNVNPTYSVTSSLNPSTTTVGTPVVWAISLPSEYILEVTSCTAFRGTDDSSSTQIDLITAGGCVIRQELISNFTDNLDGTVTASIYAFRFYDESNVFLKCNVIVCPDSEACDTSCSRAKRSIPSRMARSRENEVAIVHNILHVMDEYSTATVTFSVPGVLITSLLLVGATLT